MIHARYLLIITVLIFLCTAGYSQQSDPDAKYIILPLKEVKLFRYSDTLSFIATVDSHTMIMLTEIQGDNKWIKVSNDSLIGWMRTMNAELDLSFVEGYRLRLELWTTKPSELEHMSGYNIEHVEHTESERLSKKYLFDGIYIEHLFTSIVDAQYVGDSLVEQQVLDESPATERHYLIVPIFKPEYPHLYRGVCGDNAPIVLQCPVCKKTLCDPNSGWVNRIVNRGFELYQCVNKHFVVVYRVSWD